MANSTTNLDLISASQASKEVTANALADAGSPATLFGRRASTCVGLTWGYYGGNIMVNGVITNIANGTVALTGSTTNYVEATTAGVVSSNTTAFTSGSIPLYTIVTGTASVTSYTDQRTKSNAYANFNGLTVNANTTTPALRVTQTGTGNALVVEDSASTDATPFVIDATGNVLVGTTAARTSISNSLPLQIEGTAYNSSSMSLIANNVSGANQASIVFAKTRGTAVGGIDLVSSGDTLGAVIFGGADGTNIINAAQITSLVDGTPGTNDMPGRLVFSTTADGASTPTEAMRINSNQGVSIGAAAASLGTTLRLSKSLTGASTSIGIYNSGTVQSDATVGVYNRVDIATQAASFTLNNIYGYYLQQGTIGVGSAITNQYGFFANSNLISATNNFGFYGDIPSGTGRWNFYANGTANNAFNGNTRFGGVTAPTVAVDVTGAVKATGNIAGGYVAHADGTTAMAFGSYNVVRVTPNADATYTSTVPAAGSIVVLSILTSGTTSRTITFGTGFKSTGTLATGTVSARYFNLTFVSDGTNLIETARTVAIA